MFCIAVRRSVHVRFRADDKRGAVASKEEGQGDKENEPCNGEVAKVQREIAMLKV